MNTQKVLLLPDISLHPLKVLATYKGGFGKVYIVEDAADNKYALKTLIEGQEADKLYQEALSSSKANTHPNVLTPSGTTSYEGETYVIMRALKGNLRSLMKGPTEANLALDVITQVASGLYHLHDECNLMHLDMKPENILFNDDSTFCISDFGLARNIPTPTETHQNKEEASARLTGTFAYMSPEHFASGVLSEKSDIFSVGVILFELLTGRHPFKADSLAAMARNILLWNPRFSIRERLKIPKSLRSACIACLCKAPEQRPSAAELVNIIGSKLTLNVSTKGKDIDHQLTLAQIKADAGHLDAAKQLLTKVLTENPLHFLALSLYAQVAFKLGDIEYASSLADEALSAAIWSDEPVSNLQQALLSLSYYYLSIDPVKSMGYSTQVIRTDPNDWQAWGNLAEASRVLGRSKSSNDILETGIKACLKAMELAPEDVKLKVTYGGLLLESADYANLNPFITELANKYAETDVHVRFLLIRTLISTGQHHEADQWLAPMRQYPELRPMIEQAEYEKSQSLHNSNSHDRRSEGPQDTQGR